jgi:Protein of unknown function (DUF3499)
MNTVSNWSRHYSSYDRRLCARRGCGADAAATLRFLPIKREASLLDIDVTSARTEGDLCERHATALTLPRGFHLNDERRVLRTVTIVRELEPAPEPRAEVEVEVVIEVELEVELDDDAPAPNLLDARTPLLKRAFGNVLPADG